MLAFAYIIAFIFGTVIGSFLNVVLYRYHTGMSFFGGRSRCPCCNCVLAPRDLIPIVSFILARGHCRYCGSRISFRYPAIELATGVLFTIVLWKFAPAITMVVLGWVIAAFLVLIAGYDIRHKIIPDTFAYTLAAIGFFFVVMFDPVTLFIRIPDFLTLLSGPILAAPLALLFLVSDGRWMGLGDAKLQLGLGWIVGFWSGLSALVLAFWIGAVWGIALLAISRVRTFAGAQYSMKSELPFGPFLIIGFLLVWLFGLDVFELLYWSV